MTITVSLTQVGLLRANAIVHDVRADAARRHETEPRTVSVDVDRQRTPEGEVVPGQRRVVDVRV